MLSRENIGSRIKEYRKANNLSVPDLERMLNIPKDRIYKWEKGAVPYDTADVEKVEDLLKTGKVPHGTNTEKNPKSKRTEVKAIPHEDFMEVPYLPAHAQAGYLTGYSDHRLMEDDLDTMLVPKEFERGNYLVIEVVGNSMDDGTKKAICEGDKLLIKELDKSYYVRDKLHYKEVLYVLATKEDGVTVKEVTKHDVDKGIITCHPWNPMYKDFDVKVRDIVKLFYVRKIVERRIRF